MGLWELKKDDPEYTLLKEIIRKVHPHLAEANIVLYMTDKNQVRGRNLTLADAAKAPPKMRASTKADFLITIRQEPWGDMTAAQRRACLDHELCHCNAVYQPLKEQVGVGGRGRAKMKVAKDKYGRPQLTTMFARDKDGNIRWRLVPHDLNEFTDIVRRHGLWNEDMKEMHKVMEQLELFGKEEITQAAEGIAKAAMAKKRSNAVAGKQVTLNP